MLRKQKESEIKLEDKNKGKKKVSLKQRVQNYKSKINAKLQSNEKMFAGGGTE